MKKPTLNAWLLDLAKNLGSKAGTAYLTYGSTHVLLQAFIPELAKLPPGISVLDPNSTAAVLLSILTQLSKSASDSLNGWVAWALVLVAGAFGLAYATGDYFKTRKPKSKFAKLMYAFAHRKVKLGTYLDFLLGKLVVPFTVICTIMYELSNQFSAADKAQAFVQAIVIVTFIIGAHFLTFFGKQPNGTIIYAVTVPNVDLSHEDAMLNLLAKAIEGFVYVGKAEVQAESTDGTISVVLPIRYPAEKWSTDEKAELVTKLRDAELAWEANGYRTKSRFIPESVERNIPLHLKNLRDKKAA